MVGFLDCVGPAEISLRCLTTTTQEHGPHWLLLDVYSGAGGAASREFATAAAATTTTSGGAGIQQQPGPYPLVFDHCPREHRPAVAVTPTLETFKENLRFVSGERKTQTCEKQVI